MPKFLDHSPLAGGLFNSDYNGGRGQYAAWACILQNDEPLLMLLCHRMDSDFEQTPLKFRKPFATNTVASRHMQGPVIPNIF